MQSVSIMALTLFSLPVVGRSMAGLQRLFWLLRGLAGYTSHLEARNKAPAIAPTDARRSTGDCAQRVVTNQLGRGQQITVSREASRSLLARHARQSHPFRDGQGHDADAARPGEELSRAVVQKYVHQKITDEMRSGVCRRRGEHPGRASTQGSPLAG